MKLIIIGSGNWGTTLAMLFAQRNTVYLWTIDQKEADEINASREAKFLQGIKLPENIIVEKKFERKIESDDIVITVIPSRYIESLADEMILHGGDKCTIVNASKGVEHSTLKTVGETLHDKLPNVIFANLSGPTIAREIAEGLPAKAILACEDVATLFRLQHILENDLLKFEYSRDVKGIELAAI